MEAYLINILIFSAIYAILAISLNIVCGYTGIFSIAHAAFFGIGAYATGLLTVKAGFPFWFAAIIGIVTAGLTGALLGIPTLRLRGDYMLIATLGFGEIFRAVLINSGNFTGGSSGISGIPAPQILSISFENDILYLLLVLFFLGVTIIISWLIENSPFGQVLFSIAEDEDAAASLGRNPINYKVTAMAIGSILAGLAGALYAGYTSFINPNTFTLSESILVLAMMILGGIGSIPGCLIGATVLISFPEILRFIGLPTPSAMVFRQMIYGLALVIIMILRPRGLLGKIRLGG
ncbi:MAG: branched-chain amino acid ABC transporter permease [Candidatus Poribacteria bacterium]